MSSGSDVLPNILLPTYDPKRAYFCGCKEAETRPAMWVGKTPLQWVASAPTEPLHTLHLWGGKRKGKEVLTAC